MAFDSLSEKLQNVFKGLRSKGRLTEADVKTALKEVKMALLEADVNFKVVKNFVKAVQEKATGEDVLNSLTPGQTVIKYVNEELVSMMGGTTTEISLLPGNEITVIMMCGLQGAGKTTTVAKLAAKFKEKGKKPLLVACDIYRPAAIDQLKVLGEQIGVPVYSEPECKDALAIAQRGIEYARDNRLDLVIIDTAGRLAVDEEMMAEIEAIKKGINPQETLFVVDAMTGQDAVNTAREFNERLDFDGVVLTKLDGDTRGGAALSARAVTGKPIMFTGVGEKLDELDEFHPDRMASRILGMGDVLSLIERVESEMDQKKAEEAARKLEENRFDMNDLLEQFRQIKKMGSLKNILSMLPGMDKQLRDVDIDDRQLLRIEAIIKSMTKKEREKPSIIDPIL